MCHKMPLKPSEIQDLLLNDFRLTSERSSESNARSEKSKKLIIREIIQELYCLTIEPDLNDTKDYFESSCFNRKDAKDDDQPSPDQILALGLQCAVMSRDKSMIEYLLEKGADPICADDTLINFKRATWPIFHIHSKYSDDHFESDSPIEDKSEKDYDSDMENDDSASYYGDSEKIQGCLPRVNGGTTALDIAALIGDSSTVKMLLPPTKKTFEHQMPETANNPLITAAWVGNLTVLKALLRHEEHFPPDALGTPLHAASARGHLDIVRWLTAKKYIRERDINRACGHYGTPLCAASCHGRIEVAKFLITHGARVNLGRSVVEDTALSNAVLNSQLETIQLLLDNGALFNPALLLADYVEIDEEALNVVKDHANMNEEAKWRYNALCIQCFIGDYTEVQNLLENEKEMSKLEQLNDTDYGDLGSEGPLVIAIKYGHKRLVDLLIQTVSPWILRGNVALAAVKSGNNDIILSVLAHPKKCHLACAECENSIPALRYAIDSENYGIACQVYQSIYEESEKSLGIIDALVDAKELAQRKLKEVGDTYKIAENQYTGCMELNRALGFQGGGAELLSLREDELLEDPSTELEVTIKTEAPKGRAPEEVQEAIGLFFSALSLIVKYIVNRV